MRYDVRRSKVHLIHKLSRQAKMWKNKKGTPEQIESNKYKSERMIKEISAIKVRNRNLYTYCKQRYINGCCSHVIHNN